MMMMTMIMTMIETLCGCVDESLCPHKSPKDSIGLGDCERTVDELCVRRLGIQWVRYNDSVNGSEQERPQLKGINA